MKKRQSLVLVSAAVATASMLVGNTTSLAVSWNATIPSDSAISANGLTDQATLFVDENIVNDTADGDRGTGTYLGDGWVVTAQHVITGSANIYGTNASPGQINYNVIVAGESQDYIADTLVVNGSADIALIHLAGANTGPITTLPGVLDSAIYTGSSEAGQLVQLGGFGTWDPLAATAGTLNSGEIFHRAFNVVASASGAFSNVAANGNSILVNNGYLMGIGEAGDSGSGLWLAPAGNVTDTNLWDYTLAGELNTTSNGNAFGSNNQYERTGGQAGFITSNVYAAHLTVFWDSNSSTGGIQDGGGIWNTTNSNFGNGVSNFTWDNGATTSNAYFGAHKGAAGTVTLGANITVQNIQFNPATSGTYVIAGGGFALTLLATSNIAANGNATISAPITMPSGVSFRPTLGSTLTLSGNITGSSGTVSKFQPGTLTLSGTNSLVGTFNVGNGATSGGNTDGALRIASNGAINGLTTINLTDNNGAWGVLQFDGTTANGNLTVPSVGTVGLTLNGNNAGPAGTATTIVENIGGSDVFTGAITGTTGGIGYGFAADAGSLTLNSLNTTTTKTLYFRGAGNGSFSGVISGAAVGINQTDTGTWTLNAANTFGVGVTLGGGVLSTTRLANGGAASGIGESSNAAANLVLSGGALSFDGTSSGATNRLFTVGPRGGTLDGSGSVGLNFSQVGSEVSSDAATHAATTVVGSNVVTITAGGETDLAIGMLVTGTGIPSGATITAFSDDAGTITLSAPATVAGSPTLSFGAIARTLTLTGSTAVTNILTPSLANSAGGGLLGLTKTGVGTWVLAGASSYTGPTLVSVGTLTLNSGESLASLNDTVSSGAVFNVSGTLSSSVNLTNNGTVNENGTSQTIASLNGSGPLNLHGTALSISNGGSFSGAISDTSSGASLTLSGGTLVLSGTNTYGGGTTVSGGRLSVNGSIVGPVSVASNATLGGDGTAFGAVTITAGGIVAPGNSIGTLNTGPISLVAAGSEYNPEIDLTNTLADLLNVTGTVALDNSTLALSLLNVPDPATFTTPETFLILANDGTDPINGTFGTISGVPTGYTATVNYDFTGIDSLGRVGDGNDIGLTISVPEPMSVGLLGLAAVLLPRRRCRYSAPLSPKPAGG